jgi:hypothetical protein
LKQSCPASEKAEEVMRFITFWKRTHGHLPQHLVFDSKLTTYANLARIDDMGITFITLRRRSPALMAEIASLPRSAWRVPCSGPGRWPRATGRRTRSPTPGR